MLAYRLAASPCVPQPARREKYPVASRSIGLGAAIFALLGAPCAIGTLVSPIALGLGAGALFGAVAASWAFVDKTLLQYLFFTIAMLGTVANLYTIWYAKRLRRRGGGGA
ncbi:MAG: hypothetical protein HY673_12180 [Chloroflexi bacterium]|nr:hypothetical protein [Chloroflexota bacterium]